MRGKENDAGAKDIAFVGWVCNTHIHLENAARLKDQVNVYSSPNCFQ